MADLLSDDDVFGPTKLLTDDEVFGGSAPPAPQPAVAVTCTWRRVSRQSGRLSRINAHNCFCY